METKNYFGKDTINTLNNLPVIEYDVEEWGITARIKTLSAAQITSLQGMNTKEADSDKYFYQIIAMSLVDEKGERVVNNNDAKKILGGYSMTSLMEIFEQIKKLNHIGETVEAKVEELKEDPFLNS